MAPDPAHRMEVLCRQLNDMFMGGALCVKEIVATAQELRGLLASVQETGSDNGRVARSAPRPLVDRSNLSVSWNGRTVRLGHTYL